MEVATRKSPAWLQLSARPYDSIPTSTSFCTPVMPDALMFLSSSGADESPAKQGGRRPLAWNLPAGGRVE